MKIDPISISERAYIIGQLARVGKWAAKRNGYQVNMARIHTQKGNQIHFSVQLRPGVTVTGIESTVARAVTAVNSTITEQLAHKRQPEYIRYTAPRTGETWLPYKEAEV